MITMIFLPLQIVAARRRQLVGDAVLARRLGGLLGLLRRIGIGELEALGKDRARRPGDDKAQSEDEATHGGKAPHGEIRGHGSAKIMPTASENPPE